MSVILCYLMIGFAVYLALVHYNVQKDKTDGISRWVIIGWPMIYLLGLVDLIDYLSKVSKRE